jgi:type II secretory pathway component PulK
MIDLFTVSNAKTLEGRINVNTAPLEVLKTLPGMTDEAANNILSRRPFTSVGDLLDDSIMPESLFRGIVNNVSTKSSVFLVRVRAVARPNGAAHASEALVERTANGMRLLRKKEVGRWPGWQSWGWGEATDTLTNSTPQTITGTTTVR